MTNQDYKNAALAALKGNWAPAIVGCIVLVATAIAVSMPTELAGMLLGTSGSLTAQTVVMLASILVSIFVAQPLSVGFYNSFKALYVSGDSNISSNIFRLGFSNYLKTVWAMFLMVIKVLLWALLFIIPGLIKGFAYILTPFLIKDNPELSAAEAIRLSEKMMKGHKFDCFYLELSFIGWILLSILTLGIGLLWLMPYMYTALAAFYEDVKSQYTA